MGVQTGGRVAWSTLFAAVYAGFVVVAVAAWMIAGDVWWNQLVNVTTLWWTLPAGPLVLVALGFRRWPAAALLLIPVGLLIWTYGGLYLPKATPGDGAGLRVASFNIWFRRPDVSHVVELVEARRPDLMLVQELRPERLGQLREGLAEYLAHHWYEPGDFAGGVGVFSRFEIADVRAVEGMQQASRPTGIVVVQAPDGAGGTRPVQVVSAHLVPICPVCGPSFTERQRREVDSRRRETAAILDALEPGVPAIVGGDLNGTRRSHAYRALTRAGFRDPQREAGFGVGLTYPAGHAAPGSGDEEAVAGGPPLAHLPLISFPVLRLDWVLVRGLEPTGARVGDPRGSDHRPVIVDVAFRSPGGS